MGTLNDLPIGKSATVVAVGGEGSLRQHFLYMGIIPQVDVTMVKHAPMGDPVEVRIHGYELTLRRDDARRIEVADVRAADAERTGGEIDQHVMAREGHEEERGGNRQEQRRPAILEGDDDRRVLLQRDPAQQDQVERIGHGGK